MTSVNSEIQEWLEKYRIALEAKKSRCCDHACAGCKPNSIKRQALRDGVPREALEELHSQSNSTKVKKSS